MKDEQIISSDPTMAHLQGMVRGVLMLRRAIEGDLKYPTTPKGRHAYREGFVYAQERLLEQPWMVGLLAEIDKIRSEYPDWNQRIFYD